MTRVIRIENRGRPGSNADRRRRGLGPRTILPKHRKHAVYRAMRSPLLTRVLGALPVRLVRLVMLVMPVTLVMLMPALSGCAEKLPHSHILPIVEAERAFNRSSVAQGTKAAFLTHLAADAVVFDPEPTLGRPHYTGKPDAGPRLTWEPSFAEVARSGEFGYTAGPYRLSRPDGSAGFGHYVSVWQKQGKRWLVVVEAGVAHLPPLQVTEPLSYAPAPATTPTPAIDFTEELRRLMTADEQLIAAWTGPGSQALLAHATADIRYFIPDTIPLAGRGAVQANLSASREEMSFTPTGAGLASSGELGYTHGRATRKLAPDAPVTRGGYLRVWRRSEAGVWQVALELHTLPPRE